MGSLRGSVLHMRCISLRMVVSCCCGVLEEAEESRLKMRKAAMHASAAPAATTTAAVPPEKGHEALVGREAGTPSILVLLTN